MKRFLFFLTFSATFAFLLGFGGADAEEYEVSIPFGAYNPQFDTPAQFWYDPPKLTINSGDIVTWTNNDQEGHTVTSGKGPGRFEWMNNKKLGQPDGFFDSDRFLPGESWSFKFEKSGTFSYYCIIHPWMEGFVIVQNSIPDIPVDIFGEQIKDFPILYTTPDGSVEINFSWDPKVIKTHEKVNFIYRFYDARTDLPINKIQYDFIIIQDGKEILKDEGRIQETGGDFRQFIFEESGPIVIKFRNIRSAGAIAESSINLKDDSSARLADFTTIVYENPEKTVTTDVIIEPAQKIAFAYEIAVIIIIIPAILLITAIFIMRNKKPSFEMKKSSPI